MANYLGGPVEIAYDGLLIPADMIGSEATYHIEEGERTADTQAGSFTQGNGQYIVTLTATLLIPSMDWLGKNILKSKYNAGTGSRPGNVIIGTELCNATEDSGTLNLHYVCDATDQNDVHLYNAKIRINTDISFNADDVFAIEVVWNGFADEDGNISRLGTGNLTADAHWDAATEATVVNS